jgi:predicted ATPase
VEHLSTVGLVDRFVVISGCSGGGKSTLLAELARRGHGIVEEPGRRIVQEELASNGSALPWIDAAAFARRAIDLALADREAAQARSGWVFFDRGLIDAASALEHVTGEPILDRLGNLHRYHRRVFLAPPWPEIYATDPERRHGLDAAIAEFDRLARVYPALGYDVITLPRVGVSERADFVLHTLTDQPTLSNRRSVTRGRRTRGFRCGP